MRSSRSSSSRRSSSSSRSPRGSSPSSSSSTPISSRHQPDGVKALQAALSEAVTIAVLLRPSEQAAHISECLYARLNNQPLPSVKPSRLRSGTMSAADVQALQVQLKKVLSLARRHVCPMRCAAEYFSRQGLQESFTSPSAAAALAPASAAPGPRRRHHRCHAFCAPPPPPPLLPPR